MSHRSTSPGHSSNRQTDAELLVDEFYEKFSWGGLADFGATPEGKSRWRMSDGSVVRIVKDGDSWKYVAE